MKLLFVFGTRPEAIKLAPLILLCKQEKKFEVKICVTSQHQLMLDQVMDFFSIVPDFDLDLMKPGQTLFDITADGIRRMEDILKKYHPDLMLVQGDTTTAFVGALGAYYNKVKVAHIEAGLRSGNKYSPYPEELNRKMISNIADWHFAPTQLAKHHLANENFRENVFVVGNTVIDALQLTLEKNKSDSQLKEKLPFVDPDKKLILVTGHRRESFGKPFENICEAIAEIAKRYPNVQVVYPVHLNPNVQKPVREILSDLPNVFLIEPVSYPLMVWLISQCYFVLTDSGGIQEEAPSLGKPVLVMRDVTERTEGIDAGTAELVGTDKEKIINKAGELLNNPKVYTKMANAANPYGDGTASHQIIEILKKSI